MTCPLCFGVYAASVFTLLILFVFALPLLWFVLVMPSALGFAYAFLGLAAMIR